MGRSGAAAGVRDARAAVPGGADAARPRLAAAPGGETGRARALPRLLSGEDAPGDAGPFGGREEGRARSDRGGGGRPLVFPSPPASAAAASAEREAFAAALGDLRAASLGSACSLLSALEAAADPRRFTKTRWLEADGGTGRIFPPALPWTTTEAAGDDKNRPRLFLDSRTAEERKYPSLFRATIEAKAKERIPWISKKQQQLLLEQQRKKEEKEEQGEASLLLLEPAM